MRRPASGLTAAHARTLGYLLTIAGSWLLYEGFEASGKRRPWATKLLPGG